MRTALAILLMLPALLGAQPAPRDSIPLAEHPRPDFERASWQNLNGTWRFKFDLRNEGERARWFASPLADPRTIIVPFPWGSKLSTVPDSADIGWYERTIDVPSAWRGRRIYLVVGASDWRTTVWL